MGLRDYADDVKWRERRAVELVGPYAAKTAGGLMISSQRRVVDGWIYGGRDAFCFFADDPQQLLTAGAPGQVDGRTLVIAYGDCNEPIIQAPGVTPNAILDFGAGREFAGQKNRMLHLARLWHMSAASTAGTAEDWDRRYLDLGSPLHSRGFGLSARAKNWTAFILGLVAGVVTLAAGIARTEPATVAGLVLAPVGALVFVWLVARILLLLVPRYGRGNR